MDPATEAEFARLRMVRDQLKRVAGFAIGACWTRLPRAARAVCRSRRRPTPMPIGRCSIDCGQTISQPMIVAMMTEALRLTGHETVLDIGTGSGYQTAILAELAARVISIEVHPELSAEAGRVLAELGYRT